MEAHNRMCAMQYITSMSGIPRGITKHYDVCHVSGTVWTQSVTSCDDAVIDNVSSKLFFLYQLHCSHFSTMPTFTAQKSTYYVLITSFDSGLN